MPSFPKNPSPRSLGLGLGLFFFGIFGALFVAKNELALPVSPPQRETLSAPAPVFYDIIGAPEAQDLSTKTDTTAGYTVEATVANTKQEAQAWLKDLQSHGFSPFFIPYSIGGHIIYRIKIGIFQEKTQAKLAVKKLHAATGITGNMQKL